MPSTPSLLIQGPLSEAEFLTLTPLPAKIISIHGCIHDTKRPSQIDAIDVLIGGNETSQPYLNLSWVMYSDTVGAKSSTTVGICSKILYKDPYRSSPERRGTDFK
jgi:hypothetical protein